jgi:hypothetical protein
MERVLAVAIGLCGVYLFLSLVVAHVTEMMASLRDKRANDLKKAIRQLVSPGVADKLMKDPLIDALVPRMPEGKGIFTRLYVWLIRAPRGPSYISNNSFARALLNYVLDASSKEELIDAIRKPAGKKGGSGETAELEYVRQKLEKVVDRTSTKLPEIRDDVERWFAAAMDRLTGRYKRHMQTWVVVIGFLAAASLNIDSIRVVHETWQDPEARQLAQAAAMEYAEKCTRSAPPPAPSKGAPAPANDQRQQGMPEGAPAESVDCGEIGKLMKESSKFPVGWSSDPPSGPWWWFFKFIGVLITGVAVSLGAPFWFDLLKRIAPASARMVGPPPKDQPEDNDKDKDKAKS